MMSCDSGFSWTSQRVHLGIAQKKTSTPLLVPNTDFQEFPKHKGQNVATRDAAVSATEQPKDQNVTYIPPSVDVRLQKFNAILSAPTIDIDALRDLSWGGIPPSLRPQTWKYLCGYLPANSERRQASLDRKRNEYRALLPHYEKVKNSLQSPEQDEYETTTFKQIHIDVPRTGPSSPLLQQKAVQNSLERILFSWALRHPASGYVQGINDLLTPFFVVFLSEYFPETMNIDQMDVSTMEEEKILQVEADCFWCMSQLLNYIQENYTFAQVGIQRMIFKFEELVRHIDGSLAKHLEEQGANFLQFGFRWMNCLLMREIPLRMVIRIWDTYLAEAEEFASFHVYVCTAFLLHWSDRLKQLEFQELMLFLQRLPTSRWENKDIESIISQAFLYKSYYHDSISHLRADKTGELS